ncbi:hypothetical protein OSTOST_03624 [Ostertagia ostertagi]
MDKIVIVSKGRGTRQCDNSENDNRDDHRNCYTTSSRGNRDISKGRGTRQRDNSENDNRDDHRNCYTT